MNIALPIEPIDCSFYDWPSFATQPVDAHHVNSSDKDAIATSAKKQKQLLRCRHAIDELLQTERDYTAHLAHLVTVCFDQVLRRQKWILDTHKKTITRNANELLRFHQTLLVALEKACLDNDILKVCGHIATVFLEMGSHFTLYDIYCDKHDAAIALCNECRSKSEWLVFTKECAASRSGNVSFESPTKTLQFEDYLIKPVQRVCRYQLLLKEILHYTPRNTAEFRQLGCALGMMQTVVSGIDRRKYHRDTTERTRLFIGRLDASEDRFGKDSLQLLGNLVMAGAIDVTYSSLGQTHVSSSSRSKYLGCFVFPTYLVMVRPKKVTSYVPKHWFPLRLVELEDLQDIQDQREHAFVVRCKKHCFAFTATCQREKKLWLSKLSEAIASAKSQPRSVDTFIVSSLDGIAKPAKIRTSRSATNLLDFRDAFSTATLGSGAGAHDHQVIKRSKSHSFQLASHCPTIDPSGHLSPSTPAIQPLKSSTTITPLYKRHSVDITPPTTTPKRNKLKSRIRSEMYIRPPDLSVAKLRRQRPGSLDLISTSSSQLNMIGKLKTNHQLALRMGTDHKLRDVCTQDYLSSRSWSTLLRESSGQSSYSDISSTSNPSPETNGGWRKSSFSNLRSSTSTFSMLINAKGATESTNNSNAEHIVSTSSIEKDVIKQQHRKQPTNNSQVPRHQKHRASSSVARFVSGIPRYIQSTTPPPIPSYDAFDFQQYYNGKCVNKEHKSAGLPLPTPGGQQKKKALRASLSAYSLQLPPMKSNVKNAFGLLSQPKPNDPLVFGRSFLKTTASTQMTTKRSSRLFSWIKPDSASSISSSVTHNNESLFSSTSSTSTATSSSIQPTMIDHMTSGHFYTKATNKSNWSRKWIPSRK